MLNAILLQIVQTTGAASDTATQALVGIPQAQSPVSESFSLMQLLVQGGPIMIPIVILSIIAIYVFVERWFSIRRASNFEATFMNNIRDFIYSSRIDSAIAYCKSNKSPLSRMIEKGIKRLGRPLKEIEESIEIVGKFEVYKLEKNIVILAIIAGIAPMFGFLGNIIVVIKIFLEIYLAGDVSITTVLAGLYTKMVSSAAGLLVGITAFILYHWCNIMVEKTVQKMEYSAMEFMDLLQEPSK